MAENEEKGKQNSGKIRRSKFKNNKLMPERFNIKRLWSANAASDTTPDGYFLERL